MLEKQYDQLVKKSCLNQVNISKVSNEIHSVTSKIENLESENAKLRTVDIVTERHSVKVLQSEVEYYITLRDQQRRKNCAMKRAIKILETKTHKGLSDLTKKLSVYYKKTRPKQIEDIHEAIKNALSAKSEERRLKKELAAVIAEEKIVQGDLSHLKRDLENLDEQLFDLKVVLMEESQTASATNQKARHISLLKTELSKQKKRYEQLHAELHAL